MLQHKHDLRPIKFVTEVRVLIEKCICGFYAFLWYVILHIKLLLQTNAYTSNNKNGGTLQLSYLIHVSDKRPVYVSPPHPPNYAHVFERRPENCIPNSWCLCLLTLTRPNALFYFSISEIIRTLCRRDARQSELSVALSVCYSVVEIMRTCVCMCVGLCKIGPV